MVFRPVIFVRGHERPDRVIMGKLSNGKVEDPVPVKCLSAQHGQSPGLSIMGKMGWVDCEPLGIRGTGITEPVGTKGRQNGDTRGLGYEEVGPVPGEQKMAIIRIAHIGENYGGGHSEYGTVFVPNGAMNFIRCANYNWNLSDDEMKKLRIYALMVARPGKFTWRLQKVVMIAG